MSQPRPRLILSALKGGAGKTTVSLALLAAWRSMGLRAVPFKKGPDYIDTAWLARAAGATCRNLDPYLIGWDKALEVFTEHTGPDDLAVIEGNRGLYDGLDTAGSISTAELAKRIQAPVILIVDCTKATRTIAALVYGCVKFDPQVNIGGVVLNHIGGPRHEKVIRECIQESVGVPVLGAIPRQRQEMPERHMGLVPTFEHPEADRILEWLADLARKHLDLDGLARVARSAPCPGGLPPRGGLPAAWAQGPGRGDPGLGLFSSIIRRTSKPWRMRARRWSSYPLSRTRSCLRWTAFTSAADSRKPRPSNWLKTPRSAAA